MTEAPGTLIGLSNIVTQARSRAPSRDADADRLRTLARRALEGREAYIEDAVLLGRRVRLFSNSHHLADFWRENWTSEKEWRSHVGRPLPHEPAVTVYAVIGVAGEPEASHVSPDGTGVFHFNSSFYGSLRASAMEAFGRLVAPEGLRALHAGAVEVDGRGLLLLYPPEVIHPTPTWGLMELPGSRFLADGWVIADSEGRLHAIEKGVYFRASVVESHPDLLPSLARARFENVPDETPEGAQGVAPRLAASVDARAMVAPSVLFGRSRVLCGPLATASVFSLKASGGDPITPTRIEPFSVPGYEVNVSAFPGLPRELARRIARP